MDNKTPGGSPRPQDPAGKTVHHRPGNTGAFDTRQLRRPAQGERSPYRTAELRAVNPLPDPGSGGAGALVFRTAPKRRVAPLRALGNMLYGLGFAGEYVLINIWRALRNVLLFAGQLLAWLFGSLGRWAGGMLRGLFHDLTAPLRHFRRRRRQVRRLQERARRRGAKPQAGRMLMGVSVRSTLVFLAHIVAGVLPLAAAAVLVFTVWRVTGMNYALAVELNGEVIGHVADQSVVESAKNMLRDRISLAPNQDITDWQISPAYAIASTDQVTTVQQLVNEILVHSTDNPTDIMAATGLYINDKLYAVTTEGDRLRQYLEDKLESYDSGIEGGVTTFVRKVEYDTPEDERLYFASSVEDYDALIEKLERNVADSQVTVADGAMTLSEIAHEGGITVDLLIRRNPAYADQPEDYVPEAGRSLLIRRAEPFLQVQTVVRQQSFEAIPFDVVEQDDPDSPAGLHTTLQEGVEGRQEVWDDLYYIDGELVETERIGELTVIVSEPVEKIVAVGSYNFGEVPSGEFGAYYFPAPGSTWSSRGFGGHRGMDINGADGIGIYAANAGTVITSGWHWSYGWYIEIEHTEDPEGMVTLYGHCSALYVEAGTKVARGELIAAMGSTGVSTGTHLHLEFKPHNGAPVDPMRYIVPPEGYQMSWYRG